MIDVILLALLLALIQLWLLPMMLNISNMPYLLSSRDEPIDESVLLGGQSGREPTSRRACQHFLRSRCSDMSMRSIWSWWRVFGLP